jgi:hypothetical protein
MNSFRSLPLTPLAFAYLLQSFIFWRCARCFSLASFFAPGSAAFSLSAASASGDNANIKQNVVAVHRFIFATSLVLDQCELKQPLPDCLMIVQLEATGLAQI